MKPSCRIGLVQLHACPVLRTSWLCLLLEWQKLRMPLKGMAPPLCVVPLCEKEMRSTPNSSAFKSAAFFCFSRSHVKKLAQQICHLRSPPIGDYCVSPPSLYSPEFFVFSILKEFFVFSLLKETIMETLSSWQRLHSRGISKVLFPAFIQFWELL